MKKALILLLVFVLAACGGGDGGNDSEQNPAATSEPPATDVPAATATPDLPPPPPLEIAQTAMYGTGYMNDFAWSPDSTLVGVAAGPGIYLYDAGDLDAEPTFIPVDNGGAWRLEFSPDGSRLAIGTTGTSPQSDRYMELYDLETGERIARQQTQWYGQIRDLAFSADGTLLAGVTNDYVYEWDGQTGEELEVIEFTENQTIFSVAYSPDSSLLAYGSSKDVVYLRTRASGAVAEIPVESDIITLAFSPDGAHLAGSGERSNAVVWDVETLEEVVVLDNSITERLAYNNEGHIVSHGRYVAAIYDASTGERVIGYRVEHGLLSPDESKVLGRNGLDVLIYAAEEALTTAEADPENALTSMTAVIMSRGSLVDPEGEWAAAWPVTGYELFVVDLEAGEVLHTIRHHESSSISDAKISQDGAKLLLCGGEHITLWDTASWDQLLEIAVEESGSRSCALSSDGTMIANAGSKTDNWYIRLFDAETGEPILTFPFGPGYYLDALTFTPDDTGVIGVYYDDIYRWDIATVNMQMITLPETEGKFSNELDVLPGENLIVTHGSGGDLGGGWIAYYDPTSLEVQDKFGSPTHFSTLDYTSDGRRFVTADSDGRIVLWDAQTRTEIISFEALSERIGGLVTLNEDGTRLLTVDAGGVMRIWEITEIAGE